MKKCLQASLGWLFGFAWVASATAQQPHADLAGQWQEKARELGKTTNLVETEKAFRAAIQAFDLQSSKHAGDPAFWARYHQCRTDWAGTVVRMERFADAEKELQANLAALQARVTQHPNEPALRFAQAKTYRTQGALHQAMERSALAVLRYEEALRVFRKLADESPAVREYREEWAETLNRCALQQINLARYREADLLFGDEIQLRHRLIAEDPKSPEYRERLAATCHSCGQLARESGQFTRARDLIRAAIQITEQLQEGLPRQPKYWQQLPTLYRNLAVPLQYLHLNAERTAALRAAERWDRRVAQATDEATKAATEAAKTLTSAQLADAERARDPGEDVERFYQKVEKSARDHPEIPFYRAQLVAAKLVLAARSATARRLDKALEVYRDAARDSAALSKQFPQVPRYRRLHALVQGKIGMVQYLRGEERDGEQLIQASFTTFRRLADDFPDEPEFRHGLSQEMAKLVLFHIGREDSPRALEMMQTTSLLLKKMCEDHPRCPEYRQQYAQAPVARGQLLLKLKRDAEAEKAFRESVQLWVKVLEDFPETAEFRLIDGQVRSQLVQLLARREEWAEAEVQVREMQRSHLKLVDAIPRLAHCHTGLAGAHLWLATLAVRQKHPAQAIEQYTHAIAASEKAFLALPTEREHLRLLCTALRERGTLYQQAGNFSAYDQDLQRSKNLGEWFDTPFVRLGRIGQRLEEGKTEWARRDADDLYDCVELTGPQWYELAGLYAKLLSVTEPARKDRYASRTITALRRALEEGYLPTTPLGDDQQFRSLATRAEFQQLRATRARQE